MGFFFFNDTATTEIYTLSLHDALPIYCAIWIRPRRWRWRAAVAADRRERRSALWGGFRRWPQRWGDGVQPPQRRQRNRGIAQFSRHDREQQFSAGDPGGKRRGVVRNNRIRWDRILRHGVQTEQGRQ